MCQINTNSPNAQKNKGISLSNMANIYAALGNTPDALKYYEQSSESNKWLYYYYSLYKMIRLSIQHINRHIISLTKFVSESKYDNIKMKMKLTIKNKKNRNRSLRKIIRKTKKNYRI